MNNFDSSIINFVNKYAQESKTFDYLIAHIVENELVKGGVLVTILWFFWFHKSTKQSLNRSKILTGIAASIMAIAISRTLTLLLPFRARPFTNPSLHFVRPYYMQPEGLETWSSFPSDHAILFFALSTSIFLISKKAGAFAFLYTFFIICFPRIYFGYHFPTDILGGAVIGVAITLIVSVKKLNTIFIEPVNKFSADYPGLFYAFFFLITYQIANGFANSIDLVHYLLDYFRKKY